MDVRDNPSSDDDLTAKIASLLTRHKLHYEYVSYYSHITGRVSSIRASRLSSVRASSSSSSILFRYLLPDAAYDIKKGNNTIEIVHHDIDFTAG